MILSARRLRLLWVSVVLSAAGYLAFVLWTGWHDVWMAVQRIGAGVMVVALLLSLLNYVLRAERWRLYLRRLGHDVPRRANAQVYIAGFALTTTPGKAGELIRSVFLKPFGVAWHTSTALFFSERLADLVAIVLLTALGVTLLPQGTTAFLALAGALVLIMTLLRTEVPERLVARALGHRAGGRWLAGVAASSRPLWQGRLFWQSGALSLIAWLAEGVGTWLILRTLMPEISLQTACFIYGFAMLVGALSFLPGGLGGTEATMTGLLVLQGMPLPEAVAATVVIRLATLWFAVALGLLAVLRLPAPQPEATT